MGESTNLYLDSKWGLDDIVDVIESQYETKVEVSSKHTIGLGMFQFIFETNNGVNHSMYVRTNNQTPIGGMTLLTMYRCDSNQGIMRTIANVIGGLYIQSDCGDKGELIIGKFNNENALPYFYTRAITHKEIDSENDLVGLNESIHEWHDKMSNSNRDNMNLFPRPKK